MFEYFEEELSNFSDKHGLPDIATGADEWAYFLYLYAGIVEDIPIVVGKGHSQREEAHKLIAQKTLSDSSSMSNLPKKVQEFPGGRRDQFFKITWEIVDRNGHSGALYSINSFCVKTNFMNRPFGTAL